MHSVNPMTPTVAVWIKHPVPDRDRVKLSFVIFLHPGTLTPRAERKSDLV